MGDNKFPDPCGCIKAGGQAGENGCVERVVECQLQTKSGYELGGVRLPFLPLGGRGGEALSRLEDCVQLQTVGFPCQSVQDVPGPDAVDVVGDGGAGIGASQLATREVMMSWEVGALSSSGMPFLSQ